MDVPYDARCQPQRLVALNELRTAEELVWRTVVLGEELAAFSTEMVRISRIPHPERTEEHRKRLSVMIALVTERRFDIDKAAQLLKDRYDIEVSQPERD